MKRCVIVNPASSGGATQKHWPALRDKLQAADIAFDSVHTKQRRHATELARQALEQGYNQIIAVGGDGTVNEVVNGFFDGDRPISSSAMLGIIDAGTGGDFVKNIGLANSLDAQIATIAEGKSKSIPLGHARFFDESGQLQERYFAVICAFGISGEINSYVNSSPKLKRYGSSAAFTFATLRCLVTYSNAAVSISLDGIPLYHGPVLVGAACTGPSTGGGMLMAPDADNFSDELDFVVAEDLSFYESLMLFPRIYSGAHIKRPKVIYQQGSKLSVIPDDGVTIMADMDGDVVGYLPLEIETRAAAIRVIVP